MRLYTIRYTNTRSQLQHEGSLRHARAHVLFLYIMNVWYVRIELFAGHYLLWYVCFCLMRCDHCHAMRAPGKQSRNCARTYNPTNGIRFATTRTKPLGRTRQYGSARRCTTTSTYICAVLLLPTGAEMRNTLMYTICCVCVCVVLV